MKRPSLSMFAANFALVAHFVVVLNLAAACANQSGDRVRKNNSNETRTDTSSGANTSHDESPTSTEGNATTDDPTVATDAGAHDASTGDAGTDSQLICEVFDECNLLLGLSMSDCVEQFDNIEAPNAVAQCAECLLNATCEELDTGGCADACEAALYASQTN